jgi:hypothetical protein
VGETHHARGWLAGMVGCTHPTATTVAVEKIILYLDEMKLVGANIALFGIVISLLMFLVFHENYADALLSSGPDLRPGLSSAEGVAAYFGELQSMLLAIAFGNIAIFGFIISRNSIGLAGLDAFSTIISLGIILFQAISVYIIFISRMEVFQMLDTNVVSFQPALSRLGAPAFLILLGFIFNVALAFYLSWEEEKH